MGDLLRYFFLWYVSGIFISDDFRIGHYCPKPVSMFNRHHNVLISPNYQRRNCQFGQLLFGARQGEGRSARHKSLTITGHSHHVAKAGHALFGQPAPGLHTALLEPA